MAKTNQRGKNNNNPHGHNQYTNEWLEGAKDHPVATAAAVAGAVGAGLYLWSKRDKVGNQVSKISRTANEMSQRAGRKASDWIDQMQSPKSRQDVVLTGGPNESSAIEASRRTQSRKSPRTTSGQSRKSGQTMSSSRSGATVS